MRTAVAVSAAVGGADDVSVRVAAAQTLADEDEAIEDLSLSLSDAVI